MTMREEESNIPYPNEYVGIEAIRRNFMEYKYTCNITGILLDTKNYPLSLDRSMRERI